MNKKKISFLREFAKRFAILFVVGVVLWYLCSYFACLYVSESRYELLSDDIYSQGKALQNSIMEKDYSYNNTKLRLCLLAEMANSRMFDVYAEVVDAETGEILADSSKCFIIFDKEESEWYICEESDIECNQLYEDPDWKEVNSLANAVTPKNLPATFDYLYYGSVNYSVLKYVRLEPEEIYLDNETKKFYMGHVKVRYEIYDGLAEDVETRDMFDLDLTPSNYEDLEKVNLNESERYAFFSHLGSFSDSKARDFVNSAEFGEKWYRTIVFDSTLSLQELKYSIDTYDIYGENGERYQLRVAGVPSGFEIIERRVVVGMAVFFILSAIIISTITAYISYVRLSNLEKSINYRKTLMNSMAHDLKSPLAVVSGYAENLRDNINTDKTEHYAQSIVSGVEYINGIVNSILELSKIEDGNIKCNAVDFDLIELSKERLSDYTDTFGGKNIKVNIEGTYPVKTDKVLMARAIDNLLDNAAKYTKEGGQVDIYAKDSCFVVKNDTDKNVASDISKLWEPFVKSDEARSDKGVGLGLAIVKAVLEKCKLEGTAYANDGKFAIVIGKKSKVKAFRKKRE